MAEDYKVQLEGDQLERARQARKAVIENLMVLREIIFTTLGNEMSTDDDLELLMRVNPDDCITVEDPKTHSCGMYCDPPGICQPC